MVVVGLDSFDLPRAGCTTHVSTLLILYLHSKGFELADFPRLVRLNPALPWKTRGNAAISFEIDGDLEDVKQEIVKFLGELKGGVVVLSEEWLEDHSFYVEAIEKVVSIDDARRYAERNGVTWVGNERALPGALASISTSLTDLPNFELLAYRCPENFGTKRKCTFHTLYDYVYQALSPEVHEDAPGIICPKGEDPVLYGIRGKSTAELIALANLIETEDVCCYAFFRTNQHSYTTRGSARYVYDFGSQNVIIRDVKLLKGDILVNDKYIIFKETGLTKFFGSMIKYDKIKIDADVDVIVKPGIRAVAKVAIKKGVMVTRKAPRCPVCGGPLVSVGRRTIKRRCKRCGYEEERLTKLELYYMEDQELYPVQGRKLHLEGPYKWTSREKMRKAVCEKLEPSCAVACGFGPHRPARPQ